MTGRRSPAGVHKIEPLLQRHPHEAAISLHVVGLADLPPVQIRLRVLHAEIHAEPGAHAPAVSLDPVPLEELIDAAVQLLRLPLDAVVKIRLQRHLKALYGSQHSHEGAGVRSAHAHLPRRGQALHDLLLPAQGRDGEGAADGLGKGGQVRRNAVVPLGRPRPHPQAADHLVEDEHNALPVAQRPNLLQVALPRRIAAAVEAHRLHDDAGDLPPILLTDALQNSDVVKGHVFHHIPEALGHPCCVRQGGHLAVPGHVRLGVVVVPDQLVHPVEMSLHAYAQIPSGVPSGQADGRLGHLRTRVAQADALGAGYHPAHQLG